ncbi:MAG: UDP-N-acetylglucosamine--N-acetylmuramyl-(pentapeptide) pyrophosphoryl-undecaprenol N-acetylglucosamine transferase [Patescibacteria group bacterium]|jgi:UDP-N-acetylglucosamine--N-acetylmuramyl-(pentapeptide) pyrophosphoryl-undecaprenol N-acetylglucosamine transferase|nr:UDP-N-acetylglucosamine--N-acetylmuramyl-(pentapeptide) pyrophosphoryl-undecaprenol N-acetylglucosamine transferase [Patescibacteria group bacterium]
MIDNTKKIILSGGGTGGSVTPILAISKELKAQKENIDFTFIGTKNGPERGLVSSFDSFNIPFKTLPAGKLRRYFSWKNFSDLIKIIQAFFKSFKLLKDEKPDLIITAGSFASVPLVYAAYFKKIPVLIHQQDVRPGLANKLMAPLARIITVVFEKSLIDYGPKAVLTGNPLILPDTYYWPENINPSFYNSPKPLVLCIGGGTGAKGLNSLMYETKDKLKEVCNIVHLTGRGKNKEIVESDNYQVVDFLEHSKVLALIKRANLVVSRCGLGVLTELSALAKASILIPMPRSHQEDNALIFSKNDAGVYLKQNEIDGEILSKEISKLISDKKRLDELSENIYRTIKKEAEKKITGIIWEIIK